MPCQIGPELSRKPLPGGFGHHALRYYGRGGRCCPCTGLASRRVTPAARTSQEAWPGAESGGQSPDESRSGAPEGERAPQAESLRKQRILWRASAPNADKRRSLRTLVCAADNGWIASFGAPLPSLFFARAVEFLARRGGGKNSDAFGAARIRMFVRHHARVPDAVQRVSGAQRPGPSQAPRLRRSRVCSATLACCAAPGKRQHGGRRSR